MATYRPPMIQCETCQRMVPQGPRGKQKRYCGTYCATWHARNLGYCTPMKKSVVCRWCFQEFMPTASAQRKFCGSVCRMESEYHCATHPHGGCRVVYLECSDCGSVEVMRPLSWGKRRDRCSLCSNLRRNRRSVPLAVRRAVLERDGWRCHLCGKAIRARVFRNRPGDPTVDHLVPYSETGDDDPTNLAAAHHGCNTARGVGGEVQLRLIA
jgi:5-methylcytosine-specific restriction endonuclease McrA